MFAVPVPPAGIVMTVGTPKMDTVNCVTVKASLSTSLSLVSTLPDAGVSSFVVLVSATSVGASLAPLIVIVSTAVAVSPSLSVI